MRNFAVVTTINPPTKAIEKLYQYFAGGLIVVQDAKTPKDWAYKDVVSLRDSDKLYAPCSHYARKNLGYMEAIKNKARVIYDTDDDNIPNENWHVRSILTEANSSAGEGWYNVYDIFSDEVIWPRGFSLKHIQKRASTCGKYSSLSSIQQGLSDGEPDVDAIWRLALNKEHKFEVNGSICIQRGAWCPFNSQSTWWFPKAYPLMYLPVYASFRMTDIWRSFVAQRCLWEIDEGVTYHSPSEVFQDRNEHDLLKDFEDEIPGYLHNDKIVEILASIELKRGKDFVCDNLLTCYSALIRNEILPPEELNSLMDWINDYDRIIAENI